MGLPNSGAMLRAPMDTKQIQAVAAEIYLTRPDGLDFCSPDGGKASKGDSPGGGERSATTQTVIRPEPICDPPDLRVFGECPDRESD